MKKTPCYVIVGDDPRQLLLQQFLAQEGYTTCSYASFTDAVLRHTGFGPSVYLFPIPFSGKDAGDPALLPGCEAIFGGKPDPLFREKAVAHGIRCFDYLEDESFAIRNSVATAEGALAEAIIHFPDILSRQKCLVVGYGRCGRTLCSLLTGLLCHVTVCDCDPTTLATALPFAHACTRPEELGAVLPGIKCIFNTAPAPIFNPTLLSLLPPDGILLDLASAPGGVDFAPGGVDFAPGGVDFVQGGMKADAIAKLKERIFPLPGLPGRYAPAACARQMADYIMSHMDQVPIPM